MKILLRKILIFALVMAVVAVSGWFGRKAYKKSEEHKLLALARQYEAAKDARNTDLCLERVLQIDPMNVEAYRMIANLLEASGSSSALGWRMRLTELEPNNVTNRFAWAQTAIKFNDLKSAATALSGLDAKYKNTADYHKMDGALAWKMGRPVEAENEYAEAMRLEPGSQADILNLEVIRLVSTNQAAAAAARQSLEHDITDPGLRAVALQNLLTAATAQHDLPEALAYSKEIIASPSARFADQVVHLHLLHDAGSTEYNAWLASLKTSAAQSVPHAFELGRYLATVESPAIALRWLQTLPAGMQTNLPLPLIITDCQIAQKDWSGLLAFVNQQNWGETEFYRLAIESLAQRSLNQEVPAKADWRKSVRLAEHRVDHLAQLAQVAGSWGWTAEKTEVLMQVTDQYPSEKWAMNQLMAQFYADGKSGQLQELLARSHTANPEDVRIENNLANILLLRKSEMDEANQMAKQVYDASPNDPFFVSTYAYSLFLQKKSDEALKVMGGLDPKYLKIPSIAVYYGVIQAGSGHKDAARPYIALAETAKLLPEEKEMVRLAKAQL